MLLSAGGAKNTLQKASRSRANGTQHFCNLFKILKRSVVAMIAAVLIAAVVAAVAAAAPAALYPLAPPAPTVVLKGGVDWGGIGEGAPARGSGRRFGFLRDP